MNLHPLYRKWALLLTLLVTALSFQLSAADRYYSAYTDKTAVTSAKLTLQSPASGAANVRPQLVTVSCSVACTIVISQNGTAATTTSGTVNTLGPWPDSVTLAYVDSNAGTGTQIYPTILLAAGASRDIDVSGIELGKNSTAKNFSVAIAGSSGNMYAGIKFVER
jgi:hypothetical protein